MHKAIAVSPTYLLPAVKVPLPRSGNEAASQSEDEIFRNHLTFKAQLWFIFSARRQMMIKADVFYA